MEWWLVLLLVFGGFFLLMAMNMPVAFAFLLVNFVAAFLLWQGPAGLVFTLTNIRAAVSNFSFMPLPLFILMGEVIFQSGIAAHMIDAFDKWFGRLPGRLSIMAVAAGTLLGALTGATMASTAILGTALLPEMEKRGYQKAMSLGPILGSAGLACMIPPSGMAVIIASLANVSVGGLLIAGITPGLMMAALYAVYITIKCKLNPLLAPPYDVPPTPLLKKMSDTAKYILPCGGIIFLVTGIIFLGVATPTEAAATGALGTVILVACYRRLTLAVIWKSLANTVRITVMVLLIIAASGVFGQVLTFSEATKGLIKFALSFPVAPIVLITAMQAVGLFLGCLMSTVAIVMIVIPVFMPVVRALGFNPLWFSLVLLLCMEIGAISPPFGLSLFVMKGVVPTDTTMEDIYKSVLPYIACNLLVMALLIAFPGVVLMLPNLMK